MAARIAFGLALVGAASTLGATWPAARQETVALVGWLYVEGSLLSLLPFSGADFEGPLVWARSWAVRPSWLPYALAVLLGIGCAGLTAMAGLVPAVLLPSLESLAVIVKLPLVPK